MQIFEKDNVLKINVTEQNKPATAEGDIEIGAGADGSAVINVNGQPIGGGGTIKDLLWTNTWDYEDEWMGTDHTSHIVIDTNVMYDAFLIVGYPIEDCASTFIPVSNQYDPTDWASSGEIAESALITYDTANTNGLGMYIRKFIIKHNKSDEGDWYSFEFEKNIEYWFGIAQGWESYANESNWENVPYKIYGIKF